MAARRGLGVSFLWPLALVTASASSRVGAPDNVLIVFGDDVGYGDLGCFGHPTSRTPNLNKMAATGCVHGGRHPHIAVFCSVITLVNGKRQLTLHLYRHWVLDLAAC